MVIRWVTRSLLTVPAEVFVEVSLDEDGGSSLLLQNTPGLHTAEHTLCISQATPTFSFRKHSCTMARPHACHMDVMWPPQGYHIAVT